MLSLILLVFAFVLIILYAFGVVVTAHVSLGWLGLALWVLSLLLNGVKIGGK